MSNYTYYYECPLEALYMMKNFDVNCAVALEITSEANLTTGETIKYNSDNPKYNYEPLLDFIDEHSFEKAIDMINEFKLKIFIGRPTDLFINFKGRLYIDETKINNKTFFIPKIET
jgi:hypothetical protein